MDGMETTKQKQSMKIVQWVGSPYNVFNLVFLGASAVQVQMSSRTERAREQLGALPPQDASTV